jgi:hypothetical protein
MRYLRIYVEERGDGGNYEKLRPETAAPQLTFEMDV